MAASRAMDLPMQTDVLVVGAGPAGLTLRTSLTQLGVDHLSIERADAVQPGAKATFAQPRALECLDRLGVTDGPLLDARTRRRRLGVPDGAQALLRASYDKLDRSRLMAGVKVNLPVGGRRFGW
jgi:2-polyprenyl-6-methoxyphenol hydroxylase-like FAD-dependent oxidoreductase